MAVLWIAYYADWSGFAVFDSELKCLRYAVDNSMMAMQIEIGKDVRRQVSRSGS